MHRKAKTTTWVTASLGVIVLVVASVQLIPWTREQYWIWKLNSAREEERKVAVEKLGEIGSARVLPYIFTFLEKQAFHVSVGSGGPFGIGNNNSDWPPIRLYAFIPIGEKSVAYSDLDYTFTALFEISARSRKEAVPYLVTALGSWHVRVRIVAVVILGALREDVTEAIPALETMLNAKDDTLRSVASDTLKQIKGDSVSAK
jgi:hypothetical protein